MNIVSFIVVLSVASRSSGFSLRKCCPVGEALNDAGDCVSDVFATNSSTVDINIDAINVQFRDSDGTECEYWESLVVNWNATDKFSLLKNGSLVLYSQTAGGNSSHLVFSPSEYCTDTIQSSSRRVIKLCPCDRLICLRKCCPYGYAYNLSAGPKCIKSNDSSWQPRLILENTASNENLQYVVLEDRTPKCKGFHNFASTAFVPPDLLDAFWWAYPSGKAHQGRQLCKERLPGGPFELSVICEETRPWEQALKPLWHVPAALLLAATLATLLLCPEMRAGVHGRAMCAHAVALLAANVLLALNVKHTFFGVRQDAYVTLRKAVDVIVHYSIWASAFWLNAICINIGLGFRTNGTTRSPEKERRKFLWFSAYAWGCPVIITTIVVVLRVLPHSAVPFLYKPTMIETRSGHYELEGLLKLTSFAYYFAPMSLLLIINLVMFVFTSTKVWELRRGSIMVNKCKKLDSKVDEERGRGIKQKKKKTSIGNGVKKDNHSSSLVENTKSMMLYVRILWTMGVLETVVEIATWATSHYFWYEATMDAVDLLRAACIFSLTCCKRRVLRQLRDRLKGCVLLRRLGGTRAAEEQQLELRTAAAATAATSSTSTRGRRSSQSATGPSSERN